VLGEELELGTVAFGVFSGVVITNFGCEREMRR